MSLPAQVIEAGKKADELLNQGKEPEKPEDKQDPPPTGEDGDQALTDLKHKYEVLQGKYNAEIESLKGDVNLLNRLKKDNKDLRNQVTQLLAAQAENTKLMADLRKQAEAPKEKPTEDLDPTKVLSKEDLAHLESEDLTGKTMGIFVKLIRAAAPKAEFDTGRLEQITEKVQSVEQRIEQNAAQTWQDRLYNAIPDIDKFIGEGADQNFVRWLDEPVSEFSSRTRREELQESFNRRDIVALKKGIDLYRKFVSPDTEAPKPKPKPPIEPNETVSSDGPVKKGKDYTMAEINKFYTDQAKGLWRGKEKEAARIDKDILLAQREGRIKP